MRYPQNNLLAVFGNLLTERNERVTKPPRKWKDRSDQNSRDFLFIAAHQYHFLTQAQPPGAKDPLHLQTMQLHGHPHPREKVFAEESAVMPLHIQKLDGKNIRRAFQFLQCEDVRRGHPCFHKPFHRVAQRFQLPRACALNQAKDIQLVLAGRQIVRIIRRRTV